MGRIQRYRAVTMALYEFSRHIGLTLGAILGGYIYARSGFQALGLISAGFTGGAAVLFALLLPEIVPKEKPSTLGEQGPAEGPDDEEGSLDGP